MKTKKHIESRVSYLKEIRNRRKKVIDSYDNDEFLQYIRNREINIFESLDKSIDELENILKK